MVVSRSHAIVSTATATLRPPHYTVSCHRVRRCRSMVRLRRGALHHRWIVCVVRIRIRMHGRILSTGLLRPLLFWGDLAVPEGLFQITRWAFTRESLARGGLGIIRSNLGPNLNARSACVQIFNAAIATTPSHDCEGLGGRGLACGRLAGSAAAATRINFPNRYHPLPSATSERSPTTSGAGAAPRGSYHCHYFQQPAPSSLCAIAGGEISI